MSESGLDAANLPYHDAIMLTPEEVAEERCVAHLGIRVKSREGYLDVTHVCKTKPLPVWELKTTKRTLVCHALHLVVVGDDIGDCCPVERLAPGNTVVSEEGLEVVLSVTDLHELRALYDLRVEGPEHVYFTNGLLSHNSTGIGAGILYKMNMLAYHRALYVAPLKEQVKTFADRLQEMQRGSVFSPEQALAKGLRNNLYYKESVKGGSVRLLNILTDPSKIRGITADAIYADECFVSSTLISTYGEPVKIVDSYPGMEIVSFDEHNRLTPDRILRRVFKGKRHTWRVTTASGCELTCTGNERIRTTIGWAFLAEFLHPNEVIKCARSSRAKAVPYRKDDGARNYAGGCESRLQLDEAPPLQGGARATSEGLLRGQGASASELHTQADACGSKQRLRGIHCEVLDPIVSGVRLPDSALLRKRKEDSHPRVGSDANLGSGGLVVHGRRGQAGGRAIDIDPLVLERGGGPTGRLADGARMPGLLLQDSEGQDQDLLRPENSDGVGGDIQRESGTIHPADDALQAGLRWPDGNGFVELYVLRRRVHRGRSELGRGIEGTMLRQADMQKGSQGRGDDPLRGEAWATGDLPEGQAETAGSRNGSDPRGEGASQTIPTSERVGPAIQGQEVGREEGLAGEEESAGAAAYVMVKTRIVSVVYAGEQDVWDVETEMHHTLFAGGIAVHNCQDLDPDHLPELTQVQKASKNPSRVFAGTSKDLDTCLETQFQQGSRGIWHVRGGKPGLWWSLNDPEVISKIITVDGLRCPETNRLMNPMDGEFVHEDQRRLFSGFPSFHLPQIIVPEYTSGAKWLEIWEDFKNFERPKFLKEVMGIPVASGNREINEADLKAMCDPDTTFAKVQTELLSGKRRYHYIVSGCDWGGSDYNPASATKQSYTVHVLLGITHDGNFDLIHAARYAGMAYQDIAGDIVHNHNKFNGFAIAADNGVGHYYNAYLRDCGKIRSDRLILFQYNDVKDFMAPIQNSMFNLYSLNRTDSISALFGDVKAPKMRLRCPCWHDSAKFLGDFLNSVRSVTETPGGRNIMRYIRHGSKADDFMQAVNFAVTLGRVLLREQMIPSQQLLDELSHSMQVGTHGVANMSATGWGDYFSG